MSIATQGAADAAGSPMHAMRVGMVGFGLRAGLHRELHSPGRGSVVTHVCDVSERGRADAARALPDAVVTDDLEVLLKAGLEAVGHQRGGR
jgi:predicted dehydrogenase